MTSKEIRWKQRFENFAKAYNLFENAVVEYKNLSRLELEGMLKRFEYTFELAWKTLKDYLEAESVKVTKVVSAYYPAITQVMRHLEAQL